MLLRLLGLLYAAWFVGAFWLSCLSIVQFYRDRMNGALLARLVLTLLWPLALLMQRGRAMLLIQPTKP